MCACCVDRCGSVGTLVCMSACFYSLFMHHLQIIFEGDLKGPCSISKGLKCPKKKSWLKAKPVKSWLNIFFPGSIQLNLSIPCELCLLLYFVSFPDLSRLPFFFFLVKSFYSEISALQKKGMTCRYVYFTSAPSPLLLHSWVLKGICKDLSLCL